MKPPEFLVMTALIDVGSRLCAHVWALGGSLAEASVLNGRRYRTRKRSLHVIHDYCAWRVHIRHTRLESSCSWLELEFAAGNLVSSSPFSLFPINCRSGLVCA